MISTQFYFGSITGEINRKKYFYIINDNFYPINISEIGTNNMHFTLDFEGYYSIDRKRNSSFLQNNYFLKGKLPKFNQKDNNNNITLNLSIYPKTALLVSINVKSKKYTNKTLLEGDMYLSFDKRSKITLNSKVNILIGDFSISPSNIKFEPAFPGIVQNKIIFCKRA